MKARCLVLALSLAVLAPGLTRAQAEVRVTIRKNIDEDRMYEDVEIFRRILDRKLEPLYPRTSLPNTPLPGVNWGGMTGMQGGILYANSPAGMAGMQGGMPGFPGSPYLNQQNYLLWPATATPSLEGVYLEGRGVVYTATLGSLQTTARAEKPRPVSDWERARREVRNEKEEPKPPQANKPTDLSDVLLKLLAENGRHFSQLGENESLTVVLTVHNPDPPAAARKSGPDRPRNGGQPPGAGDRESSAASKARDLVLLGDLHQKQGKYDEAIAAYQKGLELDPAPREAANLYHKLAQAYLALGKPEDARKALDRTIELLKKQPDDGKKPEAASKAAAAALPAKLIVSAPKKLLDQVGEGKISFEDFRRQAGVQTLRFDRRR